MIGSIGIKFKYEKIVIGGNYYRPCVWVIKKILSTVLK